MRFSRPLLLGFGIVVVALGGAAGVVAAKSGGSPPLGAPLADQQLVIESAKSPGSKVEYRAAGDVNAAPETLTFTVKESAARGRVFLFLDDDPGKLPHADAEFIREMKRTGDRYSYTVKNQPALQGKADTIHWTNRAVSTNTSVTFHWTAVRIDCGERGIRKPQEVSWKECAFDAKPRAFTVLPTGGVAGNAATTPASVEG